MLKKLICFALFCSSAYANFYFIGSVGLNKTPWQSLMSSETISDSVITNGEEGLAYSAKVGVHVSESLALEGSFVEIAGLKKDSIIDSFYSRMSHRFVSGAIKFYPPIMQLANIKWYLGAGYSYRKVVEKAYTDAGLLDVGVLSATKPFFSLGLDYKLSKSWFINLDYTQNNSFDQNDVYCPESKLVSFGIGFNY